MLLCMAPTTRVPHIGLERDGHLGEVQLIDFLKKKNCSGSGCQQTRALN